MNKEIRKYRLVTKKKQEWTSWRSFEYFNYTNLIQESYLEPLLDTPCPLGFYLLKNNNFFTSSENFLGHRLRKVKFST